MKKAKGLLLGLVAVVLFSGAAYASYLLWSHKTTTTVAEPITVEWTQELPEMAFPGQSYPFGVTLTNADNLGNDIQNVNVLVTISGGIEGIELCLESNCTYTFGSPIVTALAKGQTISITGEVESPSDAVPGEAWVNIDVSRE